jgi:hypothetical protein
MGISMNTVASIREAGHDCSSSRQGLLRMEDWHSQQGSFREPYRIDHGFGFRRFVSGLTRKTSKRHYFSTAQPDTLLCAAKTL